MGIYNIYMHIHPSQPLWTEKAKVAMRQKAESGIMPGRVPVGYKNALWRGEKYVALDSARDWQVRALFLFIRNGASIRKAGLHACGLGLRSRDGKPLGPSSIYAILTNPFYTGMLRYKGELIEGKHEAIVSQELFVMVQHSLTGGSRSHRRYVPAF